MWSGVSAGPCGSCQRLGSQAGTLGFLTDDPRPIRRLLVTKSSVLKRERGPPLPVKDTRVFPSRPSGPSFPLTEGQKRRPRPPAWPRGLWAARALSSEWHLTRAEVTASESGSCLHPAAQVGTGPTLSRTFPSTGATTPAAVQNVATETFKRRSPRPGSPGRGERVVSDPCRPHARGRPCGGSQVPSSATGACTSEGRRLL